MKIENIENIELGCLINICRLGIVIEENCIVIKTIRDNYFEKGLIVYLYNSNKKVLDIENNNLFYAEIV